MIRKSAWAAVAFLLFCLLVVATQAVAVAAASIDGRWEGTVNTPNGDLQLSFNLKAEGEKLTGTFEGPGGEVPIGEGKIKGEELSFQVALGDTVITHEGKLAGETISMKSHGPWGDSEFTLKRVAPKKP